MADFPTTGDDVLHDTSGDDVIDALAGNDEINISEGDDDVAGNSGTDLLVVDYSDDTLPIATALALNGTLGGYDGLIGDGTRQVAFSSIELFRIHAGSGNDSLTTGNGNDYLDGGAGDDSLAGGAGDDIYLVDSAGDSVTENSGEGSDEIRTALASYVLAANVEKLTATSNGNHDFRGNGGDNVVTTGAGSDFLRLQDGGDDSADTGGGNDAVYFGAAFTSADEVDGGTGKDVVALQGSYAGLTLSAGSLVDVETVSLLPSIDPRFGGGSAGLYDYVITTVDENVAPGATLTVNASTLQAGEDFTLDGSAESNGALFVYGGKGTDLLTGGDLVDVFFFAEDGRFGAADRVDGGAGNDIVVLRGSYVVTFAADALTSIETINLNTAADTRFSPLGANYSYDVTTANGNVAPGATLTVNGARLSATETMAFDGSAELDGKFRLFGGSADDDITGGSGNDLVYGGLGSDRLKGGPGADTYQYNAVAESTGPGYDTIEGFALGSDVIKVPGTTVTAFHGQLLAGSLSTATFDSDLAALFNPGLLGVGQTIFFRPDSGTLAGQIFLVFDWNLTAGYQAGEDLVVRLDQFAGYLASLDAPQASEGHSGTTLLTFTVTLDKPALADVTIAYQTMPGTSAQAGSDYVAGSGQFVIAAGQQSGTFSVSVNGDTNFEGDETINVRISGAALVQPVNGSGTILNDEVGAPPAITDDDVRIGGPGAQTLVLDGDVTTTTNSKFSGWETIVFGTRRDEDGLDAHQYRMAIDNGNAPDGNVTLVIDGSALAADTDGAGPLAPELVEFDASAVFDYSIDITTGAADDVITTGRKSDTVHAGAGNDTIIVTPSFGGSNTDEIYGGAGTDVVELDRTHFFSILPYPNGGYELVRHGGGAIAHIYEIEVIRGGRLIVPATSTVDLHAAFSGYPFTFEDTWIQVNSAPSQASTFLFGTHAPASLIEIFANNNSVEPIDTLDFSQYATGIVISRPNGEFQGTIIAGDAFVHYAGYPTILGSAHDDILVGGSLGSRLVGNGGNDTIKGGLGGDSLDGGAGADTFVYGGAAESTGIDFDRLFNFDLAADKINLPGTVSGWTGNVAAGALNTASFNADLAAAVDSLMVANSAVLFTPNSGDFSGRTFAVIDANGDGNYQSGQDFVIEIVTPAAPIDTTTAYFI